MLFRSLYGLALLSGAAAAGFSKRESSYSLNADIYSKNDLLLVRNYVGDEYGIRT